MKLDPGDRDAKRLASRLDAKPKSSMPNARVRRFRSGFGPLRHLAFGEAPIARGRLGLRARKPGASVTGRHLPLFGIFPYSSFIYKARGIQKAAFGPFGIMAPSKKEGRHVCDQDIRGQEDKSL